MTTINAETASIFWSEQGEICCAKHTPFKNSDTWIRDGWLAMSDTDLIEWARQTGAVAKCECCGSAAYGRVAIA